MVFAAWASFRAFLTAETMLDPRTANIPIPRIARIIVRIRRLRDAHTTWLALIVEIPAGTEAEGTPIVVPAISVLNTIG